MATPSQPPAQQEQPPPYGAAAAATIAAAQGVPAATAPAKVAPISAAKAAQAAKPILAALGRFFAGRTSQLDEDLLLLFTREHPEIAISVLQDIIRDELRIERIFQRRMRARMKADLEAVLRIADPADRREATDRLLERERRYAELREQSMVRRMSGRVEMVRLKLESPRGAYWKLSPIVSEHTPDCLVMGEKWWPWEVLDKVNPANRHHGCACELIGLDRAIELGLITEDLIPDPKDAVIRARRFAQDFEELAALRESELTDYFRQLQLEEVSLRSPVPNLPKPVERALAALADGDQLRWPKGFAKGGQFRPRRGGSPGRALRSNIPHVPEPPTRSLAARRGRRVKLAGKSTFVPEAPRWDERGYSSPPGSTNVYKDGKLVSEPGKRVQDYDIAKNPPGPDPPVHELEEITMEQLAELEAHLLAADDRIAGEAILRGDPDQPPIKRGAGAEHGLILERHGFFIFDSVPIEDGKTRDQWINPDTGQVIRVENDFQGRVTDTEWFPQGLAQQQAIPSDGPPASFEDFGSDIMAWGEEIAERHGAGRYTKRVVTSDVHEDHNGRHDWDGTLRFGPEVEKSINETAVTRVGNKPVEGLTARGQYLSYRTAAHELGHGINPIDPRHFNGIERALEEALTEEASTPLAVERLREQGQTDVLQWLRDRGHRDISTDGGYENFRLQLGAALDLAEIPPEQWEEAILQLKFEVPPTRRLDVLTSLVAKAKGIPEIEARDMLGREIVRRNAEGGFLSMRPLLAHPISDFAATPVKQGDRMRLSEDLELGEGDLVTVSHNRAIAGTVIDVDSTRVLFLFPDGNIGAVTKDYFSTLRREDPYIEHEGKTYREGDLIAYGRTDGGVSEARIIQVRRGGAEWEIEAITTQRSAKEGQSVLLNSQRVTSLAPMDLKAQGEWEPRHPLPTEVQDAAVDSVRGDSFYEVQLPQAPSKMPTMDREEAEEFADKVMAVIEKRGAGKLLDHPDAIDGKPLRGGLDRQSWIDYAQRKGLPSSDKNVKALKRAQAYNETAALYREIEDRWGEDVVLPHNGDFDFYNGLEDHPSAKRVGPVTYAYWHTLLLEKEPKTPVAGEEQMDLPSVLRHEYAHDLWDQIGYGGQGEFHRSLPQRTYNTPGVTKDGERFVSETQRPDFDLIGAELTPYAGGARQIQPRTAEVWTELFAVVTHPEFDPDNFPTWVSDSADVMMRLLRTKPKDSIPSLDSDVPGSGREEKVRKLAAEIEALEPGNTLTGEIPGFIVSRAPAPPEPEEREAPGGGAIRMLSMAPDEGTIVAHGAGQFGMNVNYAPGSAERVADQMVLPEWDEEKLPLNPQAIIDAYAEFEHEGVQAVVQSIEEGTYTEFTVEGKFIKPPWELMGEFKRHFRPTADGEWTVYHEWVQSYKPTEGLGTAFHDFQLNELYPKLGVKKITFKAAKTGGYVWAKLGYGFKSYKDDDDDAAQGRSQAHQILASRWNDFAFQFIPDPVYPGDFEPHPHVTPEQFSEFVAQFAGAPKKAGGDIKGGMLDSDFFDYESRFWDKEVVRGEGGPYFSTPQEIAQWGREDSWVEEIDGRKVEMWIGKLLMIGAEWEAERHL